MAEKKKQSMMEKYGPVFVAYWTGAWAVTGVGVYVGMATMITPEQVLSTPICAMIPSHSRSPAYLEMWRTHAHAAFTTN